MNALLSMLALVLATDRAEGPAPSGNAGGTRWDNC